MSTCLVHDYLLVMRGAERTFAAMAGCWPTAHIYTLLYDSEGTQGSFANRAVTPSYLQRLGLHQGTFRRALPLFPRAAESLPVGEHDLVISSSSAFAHGVKVSPDATHVCYCHSPFRYVWHERGRAADEVPRPVRPLMARILDRMREWDRRASLGVTQYVANSEVTRRRIQEFYGRDCRIVHPPVEVGRFSCGEPQDYALIVTEVVRHKRLEVALKAARLAGQRVKVVGAGPDLPELARRYGSSAEFLGRIGDRELNRLYSGARMFLMPNVEEFGIAAVEAQAAGRPVVAAAAGGALETVIDGRTGVLFPEDDVDALAEILRYTDFGRFSPGAAQKNAARFSVSNFQARLSAEVARITGEGPTSASKLAA